MAGSATKKILVSAGESSGDFYAAALVDELRGRDPSLAFFGCPGVRMTAAGVRAVIDQSKLSVVGLAEVITHLPAIYGEYRRLVEAARREQPDVAILTDSSGFHLKVARALHDLGIPVVYLVAPQAWAWRKGRVHKLRRNVQRLLCIFPFEEKFFRSYGVPAHYIGHPLAGRIAPTRDAAAFRARHGLDGERPIVALLPGSRRGEIARHLPILRDAVARMSSHGALFTLGTPAGLDAGFIRAAMTGLPVRVIEGETWDLIAHARLAIAASGTVTVEAALLGAPMVTFYRVSALTWMVGRPLVRVPFYSMVNLIAERAVVPEFIQAEATGEQLAAASLELLNESVVRAAQLAGLAEVRHRLAASKDPIASAADHVFEVLTGTSKGNKVGVNA